LVYQTEPLKKPLTFAGPLSAVLYAATSAKDTDWLMRLCVVDPQGAITVLTEGKIRAYGASVESMDEALWCVEQEGGASLQIIFNIFRQKPIAALFAAARAFLELG
jgi:predicted acyl esterase